MPTLQFIYFSSEWSRTQVTIRFVVVFVYAPIQRLTIHTEYRERKRGAGRKTKSKSAKWQKEHTRTSHTVLEWKPMHEIFWKLWLCNNDDDDADDDDVERECRWNHNNAHTGFHPHFLSERPDATIAEHTISMRMHSQHSACFCVPCLMLFGLSVSVCISVLALCILFITPHKFDLVHRVVCWSVSLACKPSRWKVPHLLWLFPCNWCI